MEIELNGRKIDVSSILPLKTRHWLEMQKKGITPARVVNAPNDVEAVVGYCAYVLGFVDETITAQTLGELPLPKVLDAYSALMRADEVAAAPDPKS